MTNHKAITHEEMQKLACLLDSENMMLSCDDGRWFLHEMGEDSDGSGKWNNGTYLYKAFDLSELINEAWKKHGHSGYRGFEG